MAGKPGGSAPGGVPTFWAPAPQPVGQQPDTTHIPRAPTYVPRWEFWKPPGGTYGFVDFLIAGGPTTAIASAAGQGAASAVGTVLDTTHVLRAPVYTPTWPVRYRVENLGWLGQPPPGSTATATASAAGVGTASAVGTGIFSAVASAAGTGTASGIGAGTDTATASASGLGAATAVGTGINASVANAAGLGSATGVSAATAASVAAAAGVGTALGVSPGVTGAIARAPLFTPIWPIRYRVENLGFLDHLTVQLIPPPTNYDWPNPRGVQWPISLYTWIGRVVGTGVAGNTGVASAAGTGTANAVGAATFAATASAAGIGAANAVGAATAASTAAAAGTGSANAVGLGSTASIANAAGTGSAAATGFGSTASVFNAAGLGAANAVGGATGVINAVANAAGLGAASGISAVTIAAVFNAAGQGSAIGIPPGVAGAPGGAGFVHTFSRKKWRELQALIAAEQAAVAKAERLTTAAKREPLLQAARAAAAAVDAAEAEGENKRLDALLLRNADTLRKAIRANNEVKLLRETASAIKQSQAIVARGDDDEEMITLLLMF